MPTPPTPTPARFTVIQVLERIALPLFLFTGVLAGVLLLSRIVVLPRLSRIEVNGTTRTAAELRQERTRLTADIAQSEQERRQLLLSVDDETYQALKKMRASSLSFPSVLQELHAQAGKAAGEGTIELQVVEYDAMGQSVLVRGDVRDSGPRSMTVLAQFVESLRRSSMVDSVDAPSFTRVDDPGIGPHSPFSMTLHLP